jgi:hypothetical protein
VAYTAVIQSSEITSHNLKNPRLMFTTTPKKARGDDSEKLPGREGAKSTSHNERLRKTAGETYPLCNRRKDCHRVFD